MKRKLKFIKEVYMLYYGIIKGWHCIVIDKSKGTEMQRLRAEANGIILKHMLLNKGVSRNKICVVYE